MLYAPEVTFLPLPQPKLVLNLRRIEGCEAELALLASYILVPVLRRYTRP